MSFGSESGSQSMSQNSMLSEATSLNSSNMFGEDEVVNKYCDFEVLKKKWKLEDVEEVRNMIRRLLTRQIVSEAELEAVKKRKEAEKINQKIIKKASSTQKDNKAKKSSKRPSTAKKQQK